VMIEALNATRTGLMGLAGLLANSRQVLSELNRYAGPQIEMEVDGSSFGFVSSVFLANVREYIKVGAETALAGNSGEDTEGVMRSGRF